MNILIVSDPIQGLHPESDTGLSMLRYSLMKGSSVFWCIVDDISAENFTLVVQAQKVQSCERKQLPELDPPEPQNLDFFHTVWIRKDPPFDGSYVTLCWLLCLREGKQLFINSPSLLLRHHEKFLPLEALDGGFLLERDIIPTWVCGSSSGDSKSPSFLSGEVIRKPWFGHGGAGVQKFSSIEEALKDSSSLHYIYQPFLPMVTQTGDKRIFFFDGEYMGDFVRIPKKGSIVANLAQGGHGILKPLKPEEKNTCDRVGKFLKHLGIAIAGVDMIDGKISEINITAPTGFETLRELGGPPMDEKFFQMVERQLT